MSMTKRLYLAAGLVAILAIALGALTLTSQLTSALGGDGDDQPITGPALEACTAAALAVNSGGTVTETEVGDDGAAYGVEIRLADGSPVEVNLDENCEVSGQEADDDGATDQDGPNDD